MGICLQEVVLQSAEGLLLVEMVVFLVRRVQGYIQRMNKHFLPKVVEMISLTKGELLILAAAGSLMWVEWSIATDEKDLTERHKSIELQKTKFKLEKILPQDTP